MFGKSDPAPVSLATLSAATGVQFDGAHPGDEAGQSVSAAGDFSGDRRPDVIIGAPAADDGGAASGTAYVVTGFGDPPPITEPEPFVCTTSPTSDCDGDGYAGRRDVDCNDQNPAIHPGAVDIPRNKIDENCDGKDARFDLLGSSVSFDWRFDAHRPWTYFTKLVIRMPRAGSTIRITCDSKKLGCPFQSKTRKVKKDAKLYSLTSLFKKAKLLRKARLVITLTKSKRVGSVNTVTILRASKRPATTVRCLQPGAKKTSRC